MANPAYVPKTRDHRLFHLVEELTEVLQAIAKAGRFGMSNRDPEPCSKHYGMTNVEIILRELDDLRHAVNRAEPDLRKEYLAIQGTEYR